MAGVFLHSTAFQNPQCLVSDWSDYVDDHSSPSKVTLKINSPICLSRRAIETFITNCYKVYAFIPGNCDVIYML
jgi:hypothetical protein